MHVEWYGQSSFALRAGEETVFIDPFGDMSRAASRGLQFDYLPITGVDAHVLLVTHEHLDHNGVEAISGSPVVLRSTAGRLESPIGEVLAVASEHDDAAGTERGPNTIFAFDLDGIRVCHFGDFGQAELRPEQAEALGSVDLLFVPIGDGPTIGGAAAADIAQRLGARWVVPMHYRTGRTNFLEPADAFLDLMPSVQRLDEPRFDTAALGGGADADGDGDGDGDGPVAVVPATP
ncbi:MAG: MBL fold metallo-hydrolase [Solirubrobacteraceae bacterium]